MTTALPATIAVSRSPFWTAGSAKASSGPCSPSAKVSFTIMEVGHATRRNTYPTAMKRSSHRTATGSAERVRLATTSHPSLQDVEQHDHDQRDDQQDSRHRRG